MLSLEIARLEAALLVALGNTLFAWKEEIATRWRFTRNEGFHTKMEVLQRQLTDSEIFRTTD